MKKMYKIQEIEDRDAWNNFIENSNCEFYSFLQSWEWGKVQSELGKKSLKIGVYSGGDLIGVSLILEIRAKRGSYLFAPHGPIVSGEVNDYFEVLEVILDSLKKYAALEGFDFIRFNSPITNSQENKDEFKKLGAINAPMHENAEDTHMLDITVSEEELLKNMKKGDRYYIKRAIKEGVKIEVGNTEKQIQKLINMHQAHSRRDNGKHTYSAFSEKFTRSLYKNFGDNISTVSASLDGVVESILMTIKFGRVCVYYIAASDIKHPKFSPNYLCQWEAIKKAKADGCTVYNFWGVSPDNNQKHPIAGVSKFKRKFAGFDHSLLHAQDVPITKKYWVNWLIETARRKKRGYYYKKPTN